MSKNIELTKAEARAILKVFKAAWLLREYPFPPSEIFVGLSIRQFFTVLSEAKEMSSTVLVETPALTSAWKKLQAATPKPRTENRR